MGNKTDLEAQRRTDSVSRAKEVAKQQNLPYFEVSAKSGEGINEMFSEVTDKLLTCPTPSSSAASVVQSLPKQETQEMIQAPVRPPAQPQPDKIKLQPVDNKPKANTRLCC